MVIVYNIIVIKYLHSNNNSIFVYVQRLQQDKNKYKFIEQEERTTFVLEILSRIEIRSLCRITPSTAATLSPTRGTNSDRPLHQVDRVPILT